MPIVLIIMVFDSQLEEGEEFEMETENYNYLLPFIMQCLPAAVSIIQTGQQYDRVSHVKDLMHRNRGKYIHILISFRLLVVLCSQPAWLINVSFCMCNGDYFIRAPEFFVSLFRSLYPLYFQVVAGAYSFPSYAVFSPFFLVLQQLW